MASNVIEVEKSIHVGSDYELAGAMIDVTYYFRHEDYPEGRQWLYMDCDLAIWYDGSILNRKDISPEANREINRLVVREMPENWELDLEV